MFLLEPKSKYVFQVWPESMSILNIRGADSFDMKPALTIPISSTRVPVRFKFMLTLLREAWRNVVDFLASRPVDINFLQAQSDDEIGQKYEGLAPERRHPIVEVMRTQTFYMECSSIGIDVDIFTTRRRGNCGIMERNLIPDRLTRLKGI